jgi:hypothetical protein
MNLRLTIIFLFLALGVKMPETRKNPADRRDIGFHTGRLSGTRGHESL